MTMTFSLGRRLAACSAALLIAALGIPACAETPPLLRPPAPIDVHPPSVTTGPGSGISIPGRLNVPPPVVQPPAPPKFGSPSATTGFATGNPRVTTRMAAPDPDAGLGAGLMPRKRTPRAKAARARIGKAPQGAPGLLASGFNPERGIIVTTPSAVCARFESGQRRACKTGTAP